MVPGGAVVVSRLEHELQEEPTTFDAVFRILPWKCCLQFMISVWDHFIMIENQQCLTVSFVFCVKVHYVCLLFIFKKVTINKYAGNLTKINPKCRQWNQMQYM